MKRIGVLMGGLSREREISLRSGTAATAALKARGYEVVPIDVGRDVASALSRAKIDAAFVALHGRYGEDGTIQGLLEVMGIPYTGSGVLASAICIDKDLTKRILAGSGLGGVKMPAWKVISKKDAGTISEPPLPLPIIVKPNRGGSTIGMSIVRDRKDFKAALEQAAHCDDVILIEEFISGTEITVSVLNGRSLPIVEIVPKSGFYDYTAKYTKGMTEYVVPARIPEGVRDRSLQASERIFFLLNLSGAARMDYILESDRPCFLEVNTIPGMTETSLVPKSAAAAGMGFEDLCEEILKGASLKIQ